ncbi:piggyBac transposable element-derived protein 2-like [Nilaparvata lugens]|uniref:piggyBac transposable element-derived protein 2-like n=1 Tax=Nilaparvata lugens TaxID=108931 RepID=UPI00193CA510|nr:piggyBac transposable element-derived protein 2-like [Nilaparvata lugens]
MNNNCPIKTDKEMKKEERGAYDYLFDEKTSMFAVTWKDNNIVKVQSNHEALEPKQSVNRWSKVAKEKIKVHQPFCIASYNKWMGGVDRMDWSINKYRIKIRGKKWYFQIFTNMIDMTLVNAHILYTIAGNKIPLLDFRRSIARSYLSLTSLSDPKKAGRPALTKLTSKRVLETVRFDPVGHFIERTAVESRGNVLFVNPMPENSAQNAMLEYTLSAF